MRTKIVVTKTIACGIGVALIASVLAFAAVPAALHPATAAQVSTDRAASPFTIAQRSRSSGGSPYNSFDNSWGGWMDGGNVG